MNFRRQFIYLFKSIPPHACELYSACLSMPWANLCAIFSGVKIFLGKIFIKFFFLFFLPINYKSNKITNGLEDKPENYRPQTLDFSQLIIIVPQALIEAIDFNHSVNCLSWYRPQALILLVCLNND